MDNPKEIGQIARMELSNRMFFRLYQCANMLHKTGTRAVEDEGLTTQQWAVLGALSRAGAKRGMGVGDLARYLMVSRQNIAGVINRMERDGHVQSAADGQDRRSRLITMTESGRTVWQQHAQPKIARFYEQALLDFSTDDVAHALHYLLKLLENMRRLDEGGEEGDEDDAAGTAGGAGAAAKPARARAAGATTARRTPAKQSPRKQA